MRTLIVEDKEHIRKALVHLLASIDSEVEVLGECESVRDAVVVAKSCEPELVFLDINLIDGTGFDFLEQTEDLNLSFKVIFITAYEEYALQALKKGAVDYLLKPVDVEELKEALRKIDKTSIEDQRNQINRASKAYQGTHDTLILSLHDSFQIIELKDLMYCESHKGYTTFHLEDGRKHLASKPLKEFEVQLEKHTFTRPHQSFMVNLGFIEKYDKSGTIHLKNGKKIPVSTRKKDTFLSRLFSWNKE
ncbi:MAG: LytTR family DNA-binding domain-containing protein [Bacteroidota bacterium]